MQAVMIKNYVFSILEFSSGTMPQMASIQELEVSVSRVASLKPIRLKQCAAIMFSIFFRKTSSSSKKSLLKSPATNCGKSPFLSNTSSI